MSSDAAQRPRSIVVEVNPAIVGGTETFLAGMLGAIDRSAYAPLALFHRSGPTKTMFEAAGIETETVNYATEDERGLASVVELLRSREAALLQSSYFSPVLALAASRAGIPNVWRFGGHVDVVHARNSEHQRKVFLAVATQLSKKVVCGSEYLRRQFDLVGHAGAQVIYNGLDMRQFGPLKQGLAAPEPRIGMVAHLVAQKRHEDFIRAAALVVKTIPRARFWIFGTAYPFDDSRRYAEEMRALVKEHALEGVIEFEHLIGDRWTRMREMALFVLPSINEGASNAILEAMALGKPVIAADSGGHPELVAHGKTGYLVPPQDPQALADRMIELLNHPEQIDAMGVAARADAEARFDIRHCARQYEQLYDSVLAPS